jgi:nucleoside diphosphate kinase
MTNPFLSSPEQPPLKYHLEDVAARVWLGETVLGDVSFQHAWSLHEIASKTSFVQTEPLLEAVDGTGSCDPCKAICRDLIETERHMPFDIFEEEPCCLYDWKVEMRANHEVVHESWPRFDQTIALVKPDSDPHTLPVIRDHLGEGAILAEESVRLGDRDVAFLYSTAYGRSFIRTLVDYMTSDGITAVLLEAPDIGNRQNDLKKFVRANTLVQNALRNNVHVPDSLHEAFAQRQYFFPGATVGATV